MTREQYRKQLTSQLNKMDTMELRAFAKENHVKLYSRLPWDMRSKIVEVMTIREFNGDAFRANPMDAGVKHEDAELNPRTTDNVGRTYMSNSLYREFLRSSYN